MPRKAKDYIEFMDSHANTYMASLQQIASDMSAGMASIQDVSLSHAFAVSSYQLVLLRTIADCQLMQAERLDRIATALESMAKKANGE